MPLIKRYPNRKLYDTESKRYVTLEQITEMIRSGADIQVIDYESGDDLTSLTLTQIILEQEKKRAGFLPRTLLTNLIRTGGGTLEGVMRSVQSGLGVAGGATRDGEALEVGPERGGAEAGSDGAVSLHQRADERLTDMLHLLNVPSRRDVETLQRQLAMLTQRLDELAEEQHADADEDSSENDRDDRGPA